MDRWDDEEKNTSRIPSEDTLRRRGFRDVIQFHTDYVPAPNEGEMYRFICINCKFTCFAISHKKIICDKCVRLSDPLNYEKWERE